MRYTESQSKEKLQAIELAVGSIEKQFGKGAIMRLGEQPQNSSNDALPTGAL